MNPGKFAKEPPAHAVLMKQEREFRRRVIEGALAAHHGIRTQAARSLGIQRTYLLRLMRELGIA